MDDSESTPIEDVIQVEQEHSGEANEVLAELSGVSSQAPERTTGNPNVPLTGLNNGFEQYDSSDESEESSLDFWILLCLTFLCVSVAVFVLFMPKVRNVLEPMIGTGYVALFIRALIIGVISFIPSILLM